MISFKQFLINESIVDFERETRDPAVFVNPERSKKPLINPSIISQIVQAVPAFSRFGSIVQVSVIGSILTHRWTSHSDIDVNILVDRNKPDEQTQEMLNDLCRQVNGKPASGTAHPINYYVSFQDDYNEDNFANIYDVYSNKWRKQTEDPTIDINDFLDEFGKRVAEIDIGIGSLRRNLIDFRKIRQLSPKQLRNGATMCRARLRNISNTISGMEDVKAEMKKARNDAFAKPLTPAELKKLQTKNALPENILYKLMEYYWYWELLEDLKKAVGESETVESDKDVDKVANAIEKFTDKMEDAKDDN